MGSSPPLPHVAIFPFMSKGHTIPLIHLAHLILHRRLATITFITTPRNSSFIHRSLGDIEADIVEIPFPDRVEGLPIGVESTDQLSSISLFLPFVAATKLLKPRFEEVLSSLKDVSFLISDGFLGWTTDSALKLGIPKIISYGMGNFAMTVARVVSEYRPHAGIVSYDQTFSVPGFPGLELKRADLNPPFDDPDPKGPLIEFVKEQGEASRGCHGYLLNSFYELEAKYTERWNEDFGPKAWNVGPLCLAPRQEEAKSLANARLLQWLDSRAAMNRPVLYVAFGSQADVSEMQLREIAIGLESSGLDFLWVVRAKGFEPRVIQDRGRIVSEWVDQLGILRHESIKGFMSHCGWNSVMESVCAGVPILAWPMMAEQPLNAKLVVDELGIGLRIRASDGTKDGLVKHEDIEKHTRELLLGDGGRMATNKVKRLALAAEKAMVDGGSSSTALEEMINVLTSKRIELKNNGRKSSTPLFLVSD